MNPDIMEKLAKIGEHLRTQNNRCTASPAFCVQVLKRHGPMDSNYCPDGFYFYDAEEDYEYYPDSHDHERWEELTKQRKRGELPDFVTVCHYKESWETVQVCFTEEGCNRYLRANGHNLRHYYGTRIYADTFNRNFEMLEIREFLMALDPPTAKKEDV